MSRQLEFDGGFAREVVEVPVAEEMSESFLAYSLSVITSRAIPDVRDGLKPVQRRILWSMLQMGIAPARRIASRLASWVTRWVATTRTAMPPSTTP